MPNQRFQDLIQQIQVFRTERNWQQFHNIKDMIISLNLESAELLELAQWHDSSEILKIAEEHPSLIADELADIFYWLLLIAEDLKIDLEGSFAKKMEKNKEKYPVAKARGSKAKYDR